LRNPYVIALWSAIFPGLGHLLLSKYMRGFMLFAWEIIINLKSHLNAAIFYSFTFQFDMAKEILDKRWLILYIPIYTHLFVRYLGQLQDDGGFEQPICIGGTGRRQIHAVYHASAWY
jgi:hypothetical protein